jgi:hypothetical protein
MKLSVVYDRDGTILAASVIESSDQPGAHYQLADDLEVPPDFRELELHEFLPLVRVDVANRSFVSTRDEYRK